MTSDATTAVLFEQGLRQYRVSCFRGLQLSVGVFSTDSTTR